MLERVDKPFGGGEASLPLRLIHGDWWKEEDLPIAWERYLGTRPLAVEVGFGGGEFLLAMAKLHPETGFVGIEQFAEGYRRLLKHVAAEGLTNVLAAMGDAFILLNLAFEERSLDSVTINFPDPWPKARHARRRLLSAEFFRIAARKLREGGQLRAATDDPAFAQQALEAFDVVTELVRCHPEPWLSRSPYPVQTRYERKWIAEGRALHYFTYERRR
ncbi:MAG: tRNA (guanosine(46)-N7)-methyltransferase TrmB [Acidobacteriota bacterium]